MQPNSKIRPDLMLVRQLFDEHRESQRGVKPNYFDIYYGFLPLPNLHSYLFAFKFQVNFL